MDEKNKHSQQTIDEDFVIYGDLLAGVTETGRKKKILRIPDKIRKIGPRAFAGCKETEEIIIAESVEEIGYEAFLGCEELRKMSIPQRVNVIRAGILRGCNKLNSSNVENHSTVIFDWWVNNHIYGDQTLREKTELELSLYKNSDGKPFTIIGDWAFAYHRNCTLVNTDPATITIHSFAFFNCARLEKVILHNELKHLGGDSFSCNYVLKVVTTE